MLLIIFVKDEKDPINKDITLEKTQCLQTLSLGYDSECFSYENGCQLVNSLELLVFASSKVSMQHTLNNFQLFCFYEP